MPHLQTKQPKLSRLTVNPGGITLVEPGLKKCSSFNYAWIDSAYVSPSEFLQNVLMRKQ